MLLSLGTPGGRTSGVVSSACALHRQRVSEKSPLEGENRDELDADADRYRGARYEWSLGYLAEPHRVPECRSGGAVSTTEGLACDLDLQSLPSMIDDSRSGDHGIRARTEPRSGPVLDCLRRAESALAGDFTRHRLLAAHPTGRLSVPSPLDPDERLEHPS